MNDIPAACQSHFKSTAQAACELEMLCVTSNLLRPVVNDKPKLKSRPKNACSHAWLHVLRGRRKGVSRSRDRYARGARSQSGIRRDHAGGDDQHRGELNSPTRVDAVKGGVKV